VYKKFLKSWFDFFAGGILLILMLPVIILIGIVLLVANKGSPFFIQARPGKYGRLFHIVKFKTMNDRTDNEGRLLPDDERLTYAGIFIRRFSLDEIPQLFNVIGGEMSLVGPRPLLPEYLELYNDFQKRRLEVKPGITGWAQINGRNALNWEEKFKFDIWYVDNVSFTLDLKIIFTTVVKILNREGISQPGHATAGKFKGNN
jgi:lipopolysaccharide/colanic/teichoic acid biosynthesis glycosyltransferase